MKSNLRWDVFCKVVDNHGDIGVCWRLATTLAACGQSVRLWVDQPDGLSWLAPGAREGGWRRIEVLTWERARDGSQLAALAPADVWIESFGCDIPAEFLAHRFGPSPSMVRNPVDAPTWINLEHLSAESYVERSHGLPSLLANGAATGQTRYFFYPGFTARTGGLLRERDLLVRQARFDRGGWLASQGIDWRGERLISLFCYEPAALGDLMRQLRQDPQPTRFLVTVGRAAAAVRLLQGDTGDATAASRAAADDSPAISFLPPLSQIDFDHLLWASDLNFVRGEDSLVRAIWAGKPFVWQIYAQHDGAHHLKLDAFLDAVGAEPSWRLFHQVWNEAATAALHLPDIKGWTRSARNAREGLIGQDDLTTRLLKFVESVRSATRQQSEKS